VGLGIVLRRDESEQVFVKEIIAGFAAHRQGGLQVLFQHCLRNSPPCEDVVSCVLAAGWRETLCNSACIKFGLHCARMKYLIAEKSASYST
jgi:hypothetical protein